MTTHVCPNCRYQWSDDDVDEQLSRAVESGDATAYRIDVLPLREPTDPDAQPLRAEIGPT